MMSSLKKKGSPSRGLKVAIVDLPMKSKSNQTKKKKAKASVSQNLQLAQSVPNRFPSGRTKYANRTTRNVQEFDEYVGELNGSVSFACTAYAFNPGSSAMFPRFSREAILYEKWECVSCVVYFKPEVSAYNTQGSAGKVMLSFDYDSSDPKPASKLVVEDSDPHADGMPYETVELKLDVNQMNSFGPRGKYVRNGPLAGSASILDYDAGQLFVSTYGCTNANNIGELRVKSAWRLMKPIIATAVNAPPVYRNAFFEIANNTSLLQNTPVIPDFTTVIWNGLGVTDASGFFTLPYGNFLITAVFVISAPSAQSILSTTVILDVAGNQYGAELSYVATASTSYTETITLTGVWAVSSANTAGPGSGSVIDFVVQGQWTSAGSGALLAGSSLSIQSV